jgi:hypothetical protein
MKKKSTSQSAPACRTPGEAGFFNPRLLIGLFVILAGVFLALLGFGAFSAQAQQNRTIITRSTDPLVPVGFDCSRIYELGIDKQENMRAGAIMIACGRAQGGSASSPFGAFFQAIKKLWEPLAFGAADVDLVTGTETSPNVTQSETATASNPDNSNQIVVAYNDSRGRNASPINISGASVSTDGGATFTRLAAANGQSPFWATRSFSTTAQLVPGSRSGSTAAAVARASAVIRPLPRRIRIAGPITAFTPTPKTIENLVGRTITHHLHSTGGCTSRGTISMLAAALSSSAILRTTVSPGPMRDRSRLARHSSAMFRSRVTLPRAMFTSPA